MHSEPHSGEASLPFLKIGKKNCPDFEKKGLDYVHDWLNFPFKIKF